ncbi:unnamed protein product, partial [Clonostachys rosea]
SYSTSLILQFHSTSFILRFSFSNLTHDILRLSKQDSDFSYCKMDEYNSGHLRVMPHEPFTWYKEGGYHPVELGARFKDDRYTIRHKLGFGTSSTTWLAWDEQEKRWTSLKIKRSLVTLLSGEHLEIDREIRALTLLEAKHQELRPSEPRFFAKILDYFHHQGPNGTHTCIVTELLGPTISQVWNLRNPLCLKEPLLPGSVLRASRQLLEGIKSVHKAGLCHADISPDNVAFTCFQAQAGDEDQLLKILGEPVTVDYQGVEPRPHNCPSQLIKAAGWSGWVDKPTEEIRLTDWGSSFS